MAGSNVVIVVSHKPNIMERSAARLIAVITRRPPV
jgi:hypothetical protein